MRKKILWLLLLAFLSVSCLSGCVQEMQSQTDAIVSAIAAYDDVYFSIEGLSDQMGEQAERTSIFAEPIEAVYRLQVFMPDYPSQDLSSVAYILPEIDFSHADVDTYLKDAKSAMADAVRSAAHGGAFSCTVPAEITVAVKKDDSGIWQAEFDPNSAYTLRKASDLLIKTAVDTQFIEPGELRLVEIASRGGDILSWIFEGDGFIDACAITHVSYLSDGEYRVLFTYPELKQVFQTLSDRLFDSYTTVFYGKALSARLKAESSVSSLLESIPRIEAEVRVLYTGNGDPVPTDYDALWKSYYQIKSEAESAVSARINAKWRVPEADRPRTGSLTAKSSGVQLTVKNGGGTMDIYLRFYRINGTDPTKEDGVFAQDVYIRKGETARIRVPKGTYRVQEYGGTVWYGSTYAFGPDGYSGYYADADTFSNDYTYTWTYGAGSGSDVPFLPLN